jgi:hypothetical protein
MTVFVAEPTCFTTHVHDTTVRSARTEFVVDGSRERFLLGFNPSGWLRRV